MRNPVHYFGHHAHVEKRRCVNCCRTMSGRSLRCKHCGRTDDALVIYALLALIVIGASILGLPYALGQIGSGEATYQIAPRH